MTRDTSQWRFETKSVHAGYSPEPTTHAVAVPLYQTVAYAFDSAQHGADLVELAVPGNIHTRIVNATNVELGKRLDDTIEYSDKTYRLDTQTMVSQVKDIIKGVLGPKKINETVALIGKALDDRLDPKQAWQELPKLGMLKGEVDKVQEIFLNGGVEELPIGNSPARLANAISWFAKSAETPERRLELEQVAGEIMIGKKRKKEVATA